MLLSPRRKFSVGGREIGGDKTFIIAEIGNNHNGNYWLALHLIQEAAKLGADAVKLQKRHLEQTFTKSMRDGPHGGNEVFGETYGKYRQALELSFEEFQRLKLEAEKLGLVFFATPFDSDSLDFLEEVGMPLYKVASFDVTNTPLLEAIASRGKPVILSSGMCTEDELDLAVNTLRKGTPDVAILHCVSEYPTAANHCNLRSIQYLAQRYADLPIGYSGHEKGIAPTLAAITLGASIVERHFTLDKRLPGPDHGTVSIDPEELAQLVSSARQIEAALGVPSKQFFEHEERARNKHTKSLTTTCAIPEGAVITRTMLTCKSPGHGIKPYDLEKVIGKRLRRSLAEDATITNDDILWEE